MHRFRWKLGIIRPNSWSKNSWQPAAPANMDIAPHPIRSGIFAESSSQRPSEVWLVLMERIMNPVVVACSLICTCSKRLVFSNNLYDITWWLHYLDQYTYGQGRCALNLWSLLMNRHTVGARGQRRHTLASAPLSANSPPALTSPAPSAAVLWN